MSNNNPINYSDMFDFSDKSQVNAGIQGINDLRKAYQEFFKTVTKGQLNRLTAQEKDLKAVKKELAEATKKLSIAQADHQKQLIQNLKLAEEYERAQKRLKKTQEETIKSNDAVKKGVNSLASEYRKLKAEYEKAFKSGDTQAMARISAQARKLDADIRGVNAALRASKPAFTAAAGSYNELDAATKKLVQDLKNLPGGMSATSKEARALQKQIYANTEQLKKFDAAMNQNFRNVGNYKSALGGLNSSISNLVAGYFSISAAINAVQLTFNQALKADAAKASLEFTFKSSEEADRKLQQLARTADRLGVNYNALTNSYRSFAGAVVASKFDFEAGERIFNAITGASSRLKLSSEQTEGALLALQQMISKGNVQAEELRGQLGERIPGAFSIAARAMGKTEAELNKMLQAGEVVASEFLPKFAAELEKTFDLEKVEKVKGLSAAWERLNNLFAVTVSQSNNVTNFFENVIESIEGMSRSLINIVNSSSWKEFFSNVGNIFRPDLQDSNNDLKDIRSRNKGNAQFLTKGTGEFRNYDQNDWMLGERLQMQKLEKLGKEQFNKYLKNVEETYKRASELGTRMQAKEITGDIAKGEAATFVDASKEAEKHFNVVKRLQKQFGFDKPDPAKPKPKEEEKKGRQKSAEQLAREAQRAADQIIQANAKLKISESELAYSKSAMNTQDTLDNEKRKFDIVQKAFDDRMKLYDKDSAEYIKLNAEKTDSEADYNQKVKKITDDAEKDKQQKAEKELKRLEDIAKARVKAESAEVKQKMSSDIGGVELDFAKGNISDDERASKIYAIKKAQLEKELADAQANFDALSTEDEDYYNAKADLIEAEMALTDEKTAYEIAQAERSAEKRKEIEQQVVDFVGELSSTAFELFGSFSDGRIQKLENEKEQALLAAGENATARAKIEEEYNKRIAKEKRKAAIADKAAAIINIGINTAAAVLKVTAQTGILAPFVIPGIIALGALQAAVVAAKPIPKFEKGRQGGPGTLAIVNDGSGPELLEKNGKFRIAGGGAETLTYLQPGEKVHTAEQTRAKFEERVEVDDYMQSLLDGTGVVLNHEQSKLEQIARMIASNSISPEAMERAFQNSIQNLPFNQTNIDEDGINTYFATKNGRVKSQKSRNKMGGNG